jgi:hypothetical protein
MLTPKAYALDMSSQQNMVTITKKKKKEFIIYNQQKTKLKDIFY